MSFTKLGEAFEISLEDPVSCIPEISPDVLASFQKLAYDLKKIAPKADDFLYFSAVIISAAESSALNDDGTPKLTLKGEPVRVGWDKSGNTWKWTSNDPSIKAYKNCFVPGTQILMQDGSVKNIEDIKIGDEVITHQNRARKVVRTFITPHDGSLVKLNIRNNRTLTCTDNHPFYRMTVSSLTGRIDTPRRLLATKKSHKSVNEFITAGNLNKYDILLSPILEEQNVSSLSDNQSRLLGLFAAEGSYTKKYGNYQAVVFTFSAKERETLAEETRALLSSVFPESSVCIRIDGPCSVVTATGKGITSFFLEHTGEYCDRKILSKELVFGSTKVKSNFLRGWLEGDGHVEKVYGQLIGVTVSANMASQIRLMLNSIGVNHSLRFIKSPGTRNINPKYNNTQISDSYRIEVCATAAAKLIEESQKLNFTKRGKDKRQNIFIGKYATHTITKKSNIDYCGNVYNFEVEEDNSYVANSIIVHNCNGDIFPEEEIIKAYKKWKHKPLCVDHKSSSVDHVRGFIVDTYYDRALKRVVALCALDKASYPTLARQVSTGVSNCVSMGTAVARAICYDCGKAATTEAEFCGHMKNKTCYGEINTGLNPIELSIVMTGADAKATIKHVLAAANTMNTYLDTKQKELNKLSQDFTANIQFGNSTNDNAKITNVQVNSTDLDSFKQDVDKAIADFQKLQSSLSEEKIDEPGNNLTSNQSSGSVAMDEGSPTDSQPSLQTPQSARFASDQMAELHKVAASIGTKLTHMKHSLDQLTKSTATNQLQEENTMSGTDQLKSQGYFQGAGGVNEPTPGQVKYPKDPLNEQLREHEDKQMVGQSPFPEVGPVDGMHPSPASADPSGELERKKMLARAESEERALRRNAIVQLAKDALKNKQAYWQGGGGVNEPTPGKPTYPKDKLNEELRDYEDKQMVGQPPFPGVGPVDGLHPSPSSADVKDELKRKELLSRAQLRARFVKAANPNGSQNKAKSAWEVFLGDRLILTAAVEDLAGGLVGYEDIATKEFGVQLIEKVKKNGADAVSKLIKKAQVAPPADPTSAPPADMGGGDAGPPVEDAGKSGDPKQSAIELAEKVRDLSSDLVEAVRGLTGEQAEMGTSDAGPVGAPAMADDKKTASFSANTLNTLRRDLNGALTTAMKEAVAELNDHQQELGMIVEMYDNGAVNDGNKDFVNTIVSDSLDSAKTAVADGVKLMTAFVKYARGTSAIVKRAEMEAELQALADGAEGESMSDKKDDHSADAGGDLMGLINDTNADLDAVHDLMKGDESLNDLDGLLADEANLGELDLAADDNDSIQVATPEQAAEVHQKSPDASIMVNKTASFDSREGRAVLRAKLAADALGKQEDGEISDMSKQKFSDMLDQADKLTDGQTHLDVKPSEDLGYIETLPEINKAMMDVAKAPPKVRKEAEAIQRLVSEGKLDRGDVDELVAQGLDKDAVAYWKKFYGEVDGGSEFASELVKEHVKASIETELNTFRVKMARAYELAHDMVAAGLCSSERAAVSRQVDEIMKFNDDSFESLKRVVAKTNPMRKEAGRLPQVGFRNDGDSVPSQLVEEDGFSQLSSMFGTKKGTF